MIGTIWKPLAILAGLLLLLVYLLVGSRVSDSDRHDEIMAALHRLVLADAALHRDVLKARAGLLSHYDPIVEANRSLREAAETIRAGTDALEGTSAETRRLVKELLAALEAQEGQIEIFKSDNAVLQNSLTYVTRAIREIHQRIAAGLAPAAPAVSTFANAMLRLVRTPHDEARADAASAVEALRRDTASAPASPEMRMLVIHGQVVLRTLPEVDRILERLLADEGAPRARALQAAYLDDHARALATAGIFRILLFLAAVLLAGCLAYVFLRLWSNARILRARLAFERLIVEISAQFVDVPPDRINDAIRRALARLGAHMQVDRAYALLARREGRPYAIAAAIPDAAEPTEESARALLATFEQLQTGGCARVPRARALPPDRAGSLLRDRGVRSWLCLRLTCAGEKIGALGFEAVRAEKRWSPEDITLLRTVGDIFASALERGRIDGDRRELEARLRQSERMEAIGTLAGGIAHNFNNILGAIAGYGEMALSTLAAGGQARRHIEQVMIASRRARDLVDQILTFSRRGMPQRQLVRVQPVVAEALSLLRGSLPATVRIHTRLEAADAVLTGDSAQLQQVVMNLCTNAAQAMQMHGALDIALTSVTLARSTSLSHGALKAGRYVRLSVSDSGPGMDAATAARIFEPFFTTRAAGTGLGLATVHGIVADYGGAMNVRSGKGAGSTFEAYLAQSESSEVAEKEAVAAVSRGRGETILLVDDEEALVLLGEEMLAALGYEPIGFERSSEALAAFRTEPDRFDLVLSDEIMPGMTGTQLAAELHRIRPDVPVILMTGYAVPLGEDALRAAGVREVLKKPLLARDLAESLGRNLRGPGKSDRRRAGGKPR